VKRSALPGGFTPVFYLAFVACFLFFASTQLLIAPIPLYAEKVGGGPVQVGLTGTAFAVSAIAIRPFMGRLSDRRGRKITMVIGTTVFFLAPLWYTVSLSVPMLLAGRMLHGIGIAAFTTAYYALLADITPPSRWGEALGLGGIAAPLATMVASPVGSTLVGAVSYQTIFLTSSALALAGLAITLLIKEPRRQKGSAPVDGTAPTGFLQLLRVRGVLAPSLATAAMGLSYASVYTFLPLFARDRGLGNVGFFFTAWAILLVPSRFLAGRLSDRVGRLTVILPLLGCLAIGMMGLNWTYSFVWLMAMALFQGLGFGGSRVGLDTTVVESAPASLRGSALSLSYLCFDSGIAIGGVLMGALAGAAGYGPVYLLVGVVCLFTLVGFGLVMRRHEPAPLSSAG
jgi:MFS family permease